MTTQKGSTNQQKKTDRDLQKQTQQAAARGAVRFTTFGNNYTKVTFQDLAKFQGFGRLGTPELSENGTKYVRDSSTGWQVILDLSRTYFRVINSDGAYVGSDGRIQQPNETANDFLERSHFKCK